MKMSNFLGQPGQHVIVDFDHLQMMKQTDACVNVIQLIAVYPQQFQLSQRPELKRKLFDGEVAYFALATLSANLKASFQLFVNITPPCLGPSSSQASYLQASSVNPHLSTSRSVTHQLLSTDRSQRIGLHLFLLIH